MIKKVIPSISIIAVMLIILIHPDKYILSAQNGILLFGICVLPALFPFFFFSKALMIFDADITLGKMLSRPISKMYNAPKCAGYIIIMSLLCGYPIGAKLTSEYYLDGTIDYKNSLTIASIASTAGPIFIIGTVGSAILHEPIVGYIILVSHYLSALLNGLLYRNQETLIEDNNTRNPITMSDSIYSAVLSVLLVGGYIIIFNIICDMLINIGIIDLLVKIINPITGDTSRGILLSIIEVTRGTVELSKSNANIITKTATIAATVTFGGFSIIMQSITFLEKVGIKPSKLLLFKTSQCIIAYILATILAMIVF